MNTSRKTRVISQGISLWAALQDMSETEACASSTEKMWQAWCAVVPADFIAFVKAEQFALFDRINARDWGA